MSTYHIAILFHKNETEETILCSLITIFCKFWEDEGLKVTCLFGTEETELSDVFFLCGSECCCRKNAWVLFGKLKTKFIRFIKHPVMQLLIVSFVPAKE